MDGEATLDRMVSAGIVETDGDEVVPTEEFERVRARMLERGELEQPAWLSADRVAAGGDEATFVATAKAVHELADGMDRDEVGVVTTVLDRLEDPPTAEGAPEGFVPLYQEDIRGFLRRHAASVIFVWKPGSDSCERMADTLSEVNSLPAVDESVGLGSICVEDGAELLRAEYDVGILPTTLFFVEERVDARSVGVRGLDHVRREVGIITDAGDREPDQGANA